MNVLVVGGAGYIGSHMVTKLLDGGHDVVTFDDLSSGFRDAILGGGFVQGSLGDRTTLEELFRANRFDAVMHFASFIQVGESVRNPSVYYRNNLSNTLNLLDAMVAARVGRFIFSSTAAIFGEPAYVPIDERHPQKPINPYGASKQMVERALQDYDRAYGLRSVCLRYFNAAGATATHGEDRPEETHLIPLALDAASGKREALEVFGTDYPTPDGTCVRDYVHAADIARAHLAALDRIDEIGFDCFNVGSESGYSVLEVIRATEAVIKRRVPHVVSRRRAGDPAVLVATSSKLGRALHWRPQQSSLDTIVATAWEWRTRFPDGYAS